MHYKEVFRLHGIPWKVYSDRGPQFAARFMKALYKRLGIQTGLTTAFHPQGNGKVERKNQEVEQYLRLFCNKRQDDWVDHLPAAEFALNSRVHAGNQYSPFELIYGYRPDFAPPIGKRSNIPSLEERLDNLARARKDAEAALRLSKQHMKDAYECNKQTAHSFEPGDLVWLAAKDIKIHQKSPKLGPRQLGPFKVLEKVGELDYRLEIPPQFKIHPVIHVDRLSPWHDQGVDQPPPPEPIEVDGQLEYELEAILDSRMFRRQLQYYCKWKGYSEKHNSWQTAADLANAQDLVAEFHRKNPLAPRPLQTAAFADLITYMRRPNTQPYVPHPEYSLDWEHGRVST